MEESEKNQKGNEDEDEDDHNNDNFADLLNDKNNTNCIQVNFLSGENVVLIRCSVVIYFFIIFFGFFVCEGSTKWKEFFLEFCSCFLL